MYGREGEGRSSALRLRGSLRKGKGSVRLDVGRERKGTGE
jgi:hypothetical protein